MKKVILLLLLCISLVPAAGLAQTVRSIVPYESEGWNYKFVKSQDPDIKTFYTAEYGGGWDRKSPGQAAFGTLNNTKNPPCELNEEELGIVKTFWPSSRDLLVRKDIILTRAVTNVRIQVAVDNAVKVYFNGTLLENMYGDTVVINKECASLEDEKLRFTVPDGILNREEGEVNILAIHGIWLSSKNFLDVEVIADSGFTLTTFVNPPDLSRGTLEISPVQDYYFGETVELKAVAEPGSYFSGWTGPSAPAPEEGTNPAYPFYPNPLYLEMNENKEITANFQRIPDPETFSVSSKEDNGSGTLREAIELANGKPGTDIIDFSISGIIYLNSPLPLLADELSITGGTGPDGEPLVTVTQAESGFEPDPTLPDGLQLSGVFLGFGYTPQQSTVSNLRITGFDGAGICIGSDYNTIQGCVITLNGGDGICITGNNNTIGGTDAASANTIFDNRGSGIAVLRLGGDLDRTPYGNSIMGNSIYANDGIGIDLVSNKIDTGDEVRGITWNRFPASSSDWAKYVNNGQNFPDLLQASLQNPDNPGQPSLVLGSLYGHAGTYRIELFKNDQNEVISTGSAEGGQLVGVVDDVVITGGDGVGDFTISVAPPFRGGEILTATATDENGNTSEFSPYLLAGIITHIYGPVELQDEPETVDKRWVINTTWSGIPVHMPDGEAWYNVGTSFDDDVPDGSEPDKLPPSAFKDEIGKALTAWNSVGIYEDVNLKFELLQGPNRKDTDQWGGTPDGVNNIVFAKTKEAWATKAPGVPTSAYQCTRVRYNSITGEVTDADIIVNGGWFSFQNYSEPPSNPPEDYGDFKAVLAHEAGHGAGLGDFYSRGEPYYNLFMGDKPADGEVTMHGIFQPDETFDDRMPMSEGVTETVRMPHTADINALEYMYGHVARAHVDLMLVLDARQSFADPTTFNGFYPSLDAALELVDRMRDGDWIGVTQFAGTAEDPDATQVVVGFREITAASRQDIKDGISGLTPASTDIGSIGAGLSTAAGQFGTSNNGRRAIILLSAGVENTPPGALDPDVLASLNGGDSIAVYTLGWEGNTQGQNLGSQLAEATGGTFSLVTRDNSIGDVVNQVWTYLSGYQMVGGETFPAGIAWQGSENRAIRWQGAGEYGINWQGQTSNELGINWQGSVELASSTILPGIRWQGSGGDATLAKSSVLTEDEPRFGLALIPPGVDISSIDWSRYDGTDPDYPYPPGTITPDNEGSIPGVTYVDGTLQTPPAPYAYYIITSEYPYQREGTWTLVPFGWNSSPYLGTEGFPVSTSLVAVSDVVMDVTFNKQSYYDIGEPVRVAATIFLGGQIAGQHTFGGGPYTEAAVMAEVTYPDGVTTGTFPLDHTGNGVYRGEFLYTQTWGTYNFIIHAEPREDATTEIDFDRQVEQSIYVTRQYENAVLFANNSIVLGDNARILTGDILVNTDAVTDPGVELVVGLGASTPAGYNLKADRVQILEGATVGSNIFTNADPINAGTITGTVTTPLGLPIVGYDDIPFDFTDERVETADGISVGNNEPFGPISGDSYGDVTLEPHSSLTLNPGIYHFRSLRMKTDTRLYFTGPTELRVRYGIHSDNSAYIGTAVTENVLPADIVIYVEASDDQSISSYAVNLSPKTTVFATVFAKFGTLLVAQQALAEGAFFARDVIVGSDAQLSLASAFGALSKMLVPGQSGETTGPAEDESVPKTFVLAQNYPNPFNPTTQIKYGLPRQSPVTLTIFNMLGQEVARLVDEVQPEGYHVVQWNGANTQGLPVGSGMYIYQIRAGDFVQTMKMILVK